MLLGFPVPGIIRGVKVCVGGVERFVPQVVAHMTQIHLAVGHV